VNANIGSRYHRVIAVAAPAEAASAVKSVNVRWALFDIEASR